MIKSAVEWLWDISQVRELMAKDFQYAIELEKKNNHVVDTNEMIISDEEIEKNAESVYPIKDDMYMDLWAENKSWKEGAKWYREQLKKK